MHACVRAHKTAQLVAGMIDLARGCSQVCMHACMHACAGHGQQTAGTMPLVQDAAEHACMHCMGGS